jgi:hypothetical protein
MENHRTRLMAMDLSAKIGRLKGIVPKPPFDNTTDYAVKHRNFGDPALEKAGKRPHRTPRECQVDKPRIRAIWDDAKS